MDGLITSFVGIDVAKDSLDVRVLSEAKPFTVSNDAAGLSQLIARLPMRERV